MTQEPTTLATTAHLEWADGRQTDLEISWEGLPKLGQQLVVDLECFVVQKIVWHEATGTTDVHMVNENVALRRSRLCRAHQSSYAECGCPMFV